MPLSNSLLEQIGKNFGCDVHPSKVGMNIWVSSQHLGGELAFLNCLPGFEVTCSGEIDNEAAGGVITHCSIKGRKNVAHALETFQKEGLVSADFQPVVANDASRFPFFNGIKVEDVNDTDCDEQEASKTPRQ